MSAERTSNGYTIVSCDEPGCPINVFGQAPLGELRRYALTQGWMHQSPPWREWCPDHRPRRGTVHQIESKEGAQ